jgi:hypothetical protein
MSSSKSTPIIKQPLMSAPEGEDEDPSCPHRSMHPDWQLIDLDASVTFVVGEINAFWTVYEPFF